MFEMMQKMMSGMQPMTAQFNQETQEAQGQQAGFPFNMMNMCVGMMGNMPQTMMGNMSPGMTQEEPAPKEKQKKS